uniref:Uncharacterized protein n=1 Tax=Physcomitrium patens TaxID=3218 RepID=A0A2K1KWL3_PHYPA|nr:hypothetical protein PHYPA_005182 [Physcomitrium patens]
MITSGETIGFVACYMFACNRAGDFLQYPHGAACPTILNDQGAHKKGKATESEKQLASNESSAPPAAILSSYS